MRTDKATAEDGPWLREVGSGGSGDGLNDLPVRSARDIAAADARR
jgi:hypothetical protein